MGKRTAVPRKRANPPRIEPSPERGLALFLIAVVEGASLAGMSEREAIMWLVRLWFGEETARLLRNRVERTGEGKRAPKVVVDIMGNGYYWDAVRGRVVRQTTLEGE